MRYINKKTGAIIDSPSKIISNNWIPEGEEIAIKGLEKYTKSELFEMLEDREIPYKPEQTKKELIALLEGD
jgi:hypothetical protein